MTNAQQIISTIQKLDHLEGVEMLEVVNKLEEQGLLEEFAEADIADVTRIGAELLLLNGKVDYVLLSNILIVGYDGSSDIRPITASGSTTESLAMDYLESLLSDFGFSSSYSANADVITNNFKIFCGHYTHDGVTYVWEDSGTDFSGGIIAEAAAQGGF